MLLCRATLSKLSYVPPVLKMKSFRRSRAEAFGSYITGDPHFGAPDRKSSTDNVSARFAAFQREA